MKSNCRHCQLKCKTQGKTDCNKYNSIADRPSQLPALIREALIKMNYKEVERLQKELFYFNHGNK